jgi:hypothetical protein
MSVILKLWSANLTRKALADKPSPDWPGTKKKIFSPRPKAMQSSNDRDPGQADLGSKTFDPGT